MSWIHRLHPHLHRVVLATTQPGFRLHWRLVLGLLLCVVSWFAFKPGGPSQEWQHFDKVKHISAFCTLAVVACLGWAPHAKLAQRVAAWLMAYGLFIEAVQTQLPTRSGSLADWAADAVGIALGLALARLVPRPH